MTIVAVLLTVLWATPQSGTAVGALGGRWVREGAPQTVPDYTEPPWHEIAVGSDSVSVVRATRPTVVETYRPDGVERQVNRTSLETRSCRVKWESPALVMECLDPRDGGPGGGAPPVYTKEVWRLNASGRLVCELTWRSGDQEFRRTIIYRRAER